MEQAGRVKLDELHIGDPATGPPGHGDAVAGRDVRVAGIQVDLARATGGQHHAAGRHRDDVASGNIQQIGTVASPLYPAAVLVVGGDQIDRDVVLEYPDIGVAIELADKRRLDRLPGGIGGVHHSPMAVSALAGQVVTGTSGRRGAGELHAFLEKPADIVRAVLDHHAHDVLVAQPAPGIQGILHMRIDRIPIVQYRRDTPLGIQRVAFLQLAFRHQSGSDISGQTQGQAEARRPAADDQYVKFQVVGLRHGIDGPRLSGHNRLLLPIWRQTAVALRVIGYPSGRHALLRGLVSADTDNWN